ncbi:MAG: prolyl oligopeptidase family serine peptidase [Bacteroidetes bacterium]|nr:prolyl oligopeptidase family serine peptidase [Bacteroidota bacterium]
MALRLIKEQSKVNPDSRQELLIRNGWGDKVADGTETFRILYHSDGYLIDGYMSKPKEIEKKLPLIVWNRGGDQDDGRIDDFLACGMLGEIASWGYIVIASQYRQSDEFGGTELNDVLNVLKAGMEIEEFDGENAGAEGWSRGGMMTYLLLTKINFLKCAVSVAGLSNLKRNFELNPKLRQKFYSRFGKFSPDMVSRETDARSAVLFYRNISELTPLLLIHGTGDDKVSYEDSVDLYRLLKPARKSELDIKLIENGDHYLRNARKEVSELRKNWFDRFLKLKY